MNRRAPYWPLIKVSIAAAILKPLSFGERCQDRSADGGSEKRGIWRRRSAA
jgi:hypothetical protein